MDDPRSLTPPSLQDLCLYSLVGRFEEYSLQSLSLLPVSLRRQLLLRLPVADIMKIENDPVFMEGLDPDSVWNGLFQTRLVPSNPTFSETIIKYKNAKEYYLTEVSLQILTYSRWYGRYRIPNSSYPESHNYGIEYMLYGVNVENPQGLNVSQFVNNNSMDISWLVPNKYVGIVPDVNGYVETMVQWFVNTFNWYPERIDLCEQDCLHPFINVEDFQTFFSKISIVSVSNYDYHFYSSYYTRLKEFWGVLGSLQTCPLEKVVFSASLSNLDYTLGTILVDNNCCDRRQMYQRLFGLKHIEILCNEGRKDPREHDFAGSVTSSMFEVIPFLDYQIVLETLVVEGMENLVRRGHELTLTFDGYEPFYNYLPYFIRKPSFKTLCLARCKVPINSVKSMISTFLSTPTDHEQCLNLLDCDIVNSCGKIFSSDFPLINQDITSPCVSGTNKSLCVKNSSSLPLSWLLEYPMLQLKRLELQFTQFGSCELKALESYPRSSVDTLSCQFKSCNHSSDDKELFCKFLELVPVSEIEIEGTAAKYIPVLANALLHSHQLTLLKKISLKQCISNASEIQTFFNALFSRPKDQLAEFSLKIYKVGGFALQNLLDSWTANSRGQKLKSLFIVLEQDVQEDNERTKKLSELSEISHNCHID